MRVLISADMEGATGVTWTADVEAGTEQWQRFRRMFTGDVNACVAGLFEGGATDVLVNEAHSSQRNLLLEDLDARARMLTGKHKPMAMMQGIASGVDGVVFLGYHSGSGADGVLSHTWLPGGIVGVWLDGQHASEGRLNAALAAEHGVPVILFTGDDLACADAADYAPEAVPVAVKECVSRYAAICMPPARTTELIADGARTAMAVAGRRGPVERPHHIEIEFTGTQLAHAAAVVPTVELIDVRRIGFDAASMTAAMKAFKVVCSIAGNAMEGEYG